MNRFLRETWELWYWAMFCPSKLQQRINKWTPKEERDTNFSDILLVSTNERFLLQFLLIVAFHVSPLLVSVGFGSNGLAWLLLPTAVLSAYGVALLSLPVGLYIPLLFSLTYVAAPSAVNEQLFATFQEVEATIPSFRMLSYGASVGAVTFCFNSAVVYLLLNRQWRTLAQIVAVLGSSVAVLGGAWIGSQSLLFTSLVGGSAVFFLSMLRDGGATVSVSVGVALLAAIGVGAVTGVIIAVGIGSVIVVGVGIGVAIGTAGGVGGVVGYRFANSLVGSFVGIAVGIVVGIIAGINAGTVAGIVATTSALPLLAFLLAVALFSFSFSYTRRRWLGFGIGVTFIALGFGALGWQASFSLIVAITIYYRFVPEYVLFSLILFDPGFNLFSRRKSDRTEFLQALIDKNFIDKNNEEWLKRLPPFSSELLWFALPRHEQLLTTVFRSNPTLGLQALKAMQTSSLSGLQKTASKALPLIVADYLSTFKYASSFQQLLVEDDNAHPHELLITLLPNFYSSSEEANDISRILPEFELAAVLPRLRNVARDTDAALQANNFALRERGLEKVADRLDALPTQLPSLSLSVAAIQRWTAVIQRWQRIVEYELSEQKKVSQGELLNPFQYGNPLRRNRTDLFKGRQSFAENIARILLDRNRPTIILHGPRRCGKTSFLYNLPRLLPSQWIPIFVDAQSSAATTDEAGFCQSLVRAIIRDGRSQGLKFPAIPDRSEFLAAPYITLETWLSQALDDLSTKDPEKRLLLTIDEFEKIGSAMDEGKLTVALFDELRSLIQHWDQLGFVFCGVQTLDELGPNWSSYFISVVPVEMLYLQLNEATELLTDPDPDFSLSYAPGLIDEILQLTQCHPNLLQLIGAALVEIANERHTTTATADILQAAIPRAFTLGTAYFINVWTEFTGNPQNPAEVQTGQILLKALAEGIQPDANADDLTKQALRRMERYHVLKRTNGQYAFDIPLIQRWVNERAILE